MPAKKGTLQEKYRRNAAVYRARYPEKHRKNTTDHARKVREAARSIKVILGCVDCGYHESADALEFDHVRGEKVANISRITTMKKLFREIEKCEVRCSNCHRIRTARRARGEE